MDIDILLSKLRTIPIEQQSKELKIAFSSYKKVIEQYNEAVWELVKANSDPDDKEYLKSAKSNFKSLKSELKLSEKELRKAFKNQNHIFYEIST